MDRDTFEARVADALATVPPRFRDAMANLAIVVEDEPSKELLREMAIAPPSTLLGLYQGVPITKRHWDHGNILPDRIVIFQGPHEREARDDEDLTAAIGETLIHEIGHYFGLSEEAIAEIEAKYLASSRTPPPVIRAKKRFGQHFLEPVWAAKLVQAIAPKRDDTFLEIGPGPGALTTPLARIARQIVAVEIDRDLAQQLRETGPSNVTVVEGDILETPLESIRAALQGGPDAPIRVAGNLPYNVGSPILFRLTDWYAHGLVITDATVMLQREVADRLLAQPGTAEYGSLTIGIRQFAEVVRLLALPPGAFRPSPKVHSSVVGIRFHPANPPASDVPAFRRMTQALFSRRRKTLANALLAYEPATTRDARELLRLADIDPQRRPQTLTLSELGRLFATVHPSAS